VAAALVIASPSAAGARGTSVAVRTIFVGGSPDRVAFGASGVWVGDLGHLARVDPTTDRVVHVPGASTPIGVAADQVWAGLVDQPDAVGRVDPSTARVVARLDVGGAPTGIAVGAGAVWVLDSDAILSRVDPTTNTVTARLALGGVAPAVAAGEQIGALGFGVAVGAGAVWASGRSLTNRTSMLWRVDPTSGSFTAVPIGTDCAFLSGGAADVWGACGTAQRVDVAATALVDTAADALQGITVDEPSSWALGRDGTITRLDAATGTVEATYAGPSGTEGIAAGANALWLASPHLHEPSPSGAGTLLRVSVPSS
jgi:hypothetical protein